MIVSGAAIAIAALVWWIDRPTRRRCRAARAMTRHSRERDRAVRRLQREVRTHHLGDKFYRVGSTTVVWCPHDRKGR